MTFIPHRPVVYGPHRWHCVNRFPDDCPWDREASVDNHPTTYYSRRPMLGFILGVGLTLYLVGAVVTGFLMAITRDIPVWLKVLCTVLWLPALVWGYIDNATRKED